jgi:putative transposase
MARALRVVTPGLTYHVWANGVHGMPIFREPQDKDVALMLLREEVELSDWTCLEYAVMTTHYHVMLRPNKETLSTGFQRFGIRYAQYYNKRYEQRGHVFETRFNSKLVDGPDAQLEVARYIALNPTRAKMCRLPQQYPWSSYGAIAGFYPKDPIVDLKAALAPMRGSRSAYRAYVEELDPRARRAVTPRRKR